MVSERMRTIEGFPPKLATELKHCILAHHGELEYGSPKKPALLEAMALNFADNADAKMETMIEVLRGAEITRDGWDITGCWRRISARRQTAETEHKKSENAPAWARFLIKKGKEVM